MKIEYLDCDGKDKLFTWYTHDFKTKTIDGKFYMIDGGFSYYKRYSGGTLKYDEVKNLITDIRESFTWNQNYDENNLKLPKTKVSLLKDLSSSHICGILSYFINKLYNNIDLKHNIVDNQWCVIQEVFIQELNYRIKNNL